MKIENENEKKYREEIFEYLKSIDLGFNSEEEKDVFSELFLKDEISEQELLEKLK